METDWEKVSMESYVRPESCTMCALKEYDRQAKKIRREELKQEVARIEVRFDAHQELSHFRITTAPGTCDCDKRKVLEEAGFLWRREDGTWWRMFDRNRATGAKDCYLVTGCEFCGSPFL